jgi:hypothetical protein
MLQKKTQGGHCGPPLPLNTANVAKKTQGGELIMTFPPIVTSIVKKNAKKGM